MAKVRAEDGSLVDPSYYNPPPVTAPSPKKKEPSKWRITGVVERPPIEDTHGPKFRVIRPSGASFIARAPAHIICRDGDTVICEQQPGGWVVVENLDYTAKANPVSEVTGSSGSTVGGSTGSAPGVPSVSTTIPNLNVTVPADAGSVSLTAINDNRQVLRDLNTKMSSLESYLSYLVTTLAQIASALGSDVSRTSSVASRVASVESSVNTTKAVVDETKESVNKVTKAVKRSGIAFADINYGGGVYSGMVTRRNMKTDYARVRVTSEEEENAFVGSFHDLQRGDYVKVNTSGGTGTWYIVDYMDPADIGL